MRGESDLSTVEYMPVPPTALVVDDDPVLLEAACSRFASPTSAWTVVIR